MLFDMFILCGKTIFVQFDKSGNVLTTPIEELQTVGVPYFYNSNAQVDLGVDGLPY